ncbi:hypothetical protein D3C81_1815000 [compost metagenome]
MPRLLGRQAAPQSIDQGVGRAIGHVPAGCKPLGEEVQRARIHRTGAQGDDLTDLEILEMDMQGFGHAVRLLRRRVLPKPEPAACRHGRR